MIVSEQNLPLLKIDLRDQLKETDSITTDDIGVAKPILIKRRRQIVPRYVDFRKSSATKRDWKINKYAHLSGVRKFSKSVAGKRFHRNLANFMARRDLYYGHEESYLDRYVSAELVSLLSSYRTHLLLEFKYYQTLSEEVDFFILAEDVLHDLDKLCLDLTNSIMEYKDFKLSATVADYVIRLLDKEDLIKTLPSVSGKSLKKATEIWNKAEAVVEKDFGVKEDEDRYYSLVLGTTMRMLGIKKEPSSSGANN